jgi:hypothetical protein
MITFNVIHKKIKGQSIVIIPLSNSVKQVTMLLDDWNELQDLGATLPWMLKQGNVVVRNNGKYLNVARLIMDSYPGIVIRFLDHDLTNLIRTNLIKGKGNSTSRARDSLIKEYRHNPPLIINTKESSNEDKTQNKRVRK